MGEAVIDEEKLLPILEGAERMCRAEVINASSVVSGKWRGKAEGIRFAIETINELKERAYDNSSPVDHPAR